ncbi:MAG: DUF885 domain-containing protein [Burkholderiaceae bacterium]|nr:DUF885 domain-containing protein [Burkholderiaceae bacterium]
MKKTILLALFACTTVASAAAAASPAEPIADFTRSYSDAYAALNMGQLELSYQANIGRLLGETDVARQRAVFGNAARQLATLDTSKASQCQRVDLQRIAFETTLNLQKLDLLEQFKALGDQAKVTDQGLYQMPLGRAWYAYMLKRWLTADATPADLMAFGKAETARVLARYRQLQAQMGYAGKDTEFAAYLAEPGFVYAGSATPQQDYETKQATVVRNLDQLFLARGIEPAVIKESDRGAAFPTDGYYDPPTQTFYFNKSKPHYERRSLDWLMLHEGMPGHHYQARYALQGGGCQSQLPPVFYSAYIEGWAAYVEEFGATLGLYQEASSELGAVEWDLVRSIRVVLDVGINHDGWTHEQALAYWHQTLPMLPGVAEREIARVRNWPAQAITYKYGADLFRQLRAKAQAKEGTAFDIRQFHDRMLRNGPLPLAVLQ